MLHGNSVSGRRFHIRRGRRLFLGIRAAAFRGGGWGCVRASWRVPFAVTGVSFDKEALAAAYPVVAR